MNETLSVNKISGSNRWEIPKELAEEFKLVEGNGIKISCGSLSSQATIANGSSGNLGFSNDILNTLSVPEQLKLGIKLTNNGDFRLGPVIGILTFPHVLANKDFYRYVPYALRIKNIGLLYIFSPLSIDSVRKVITGYQYNEHQNTWLEREFPFPDVVMDRIYPNNTEAQLKLETVIGPNRIFNKRTLISKFDFYTTLHKDGLLRNHIPETRHFRKISDFDYMLGKYPGVFLKPDGGMKGKGIVQAAKTKSNLICRFMTSNGPITKAVKQSSDIFKILNSTDTPNKKYIVQAEITRMKHKNKLFEFRVMAVKNGSNQWSTPAIFAKIADADAFLTNISSGAKIVFFKNILNGIGDRLPYPQKHFSTLLSSLSIKTASILDKSFGPLGKLGIDIVVDNTGKPWLIEANGNPGLMPRVALYEYPEWQHQMYEYPLAYCLYLSGFSHLTNPFPT